MNVEQLDVFMLLAGLYPQAIPTDNIVVIESWGHFLADIPAPLLLAFTEAWARSESRAPTIADIEDRIARIEGTGTEAAWDRVLSIVRSAGYRDGEVPKGRGFSGDLRIEDAVQEAGGWYAIGRANSDQMVWRKREFTAAYVALGQVRMIQEGDTSGQNNPRLRDGVWDRVRIGPEEGTRRRAGGVDTTDGSPLESTPRRIPDPSDARSRS